MGTSPSTTRRTMLSKVPEVTIYFWMIKILCTTVGESFADYVNENARRSGSPTRPWLFTRRPRRGPGRHSSGSVATCPGVYWLVVVLISVVGTLLTDNLTDARGVPLAVSSTVFTIAPRGGLRRVVRP